MDNANQMAILVATAAALANEGISTVENLVEIFPEDIDKISKIFRSQLQH